jgi:hypothetical protein
MICILISWNKKDENVLKKMWCWIYANQDNAQNFSLLFFILYLMRGAKAKIVDWVTVSLPLRKLFVLKSRKFSHIGPLINFKIIRLVFEPRHWDYILKETIQSGFSCDFKTIISLSAMLALFFKQKISLGINCFIYLAFYRPLRLDATGTQHCKSS